MPCTMLRWTDHNGTTLQVPQNYTDLLGPTKPLNHRITWPCGLPYLNPGTGVNKAQELGQEIEARGGRGNPKTTVAGATGKQCPDQKPTGCKLTPQGLHEAHGPTTGQP